MRSDIVRVDVTRVRSGGRELTEDWVAAEAPLEIRLGATPFAVIMRTPGRDRDLAAGFLFSEQVLRSPEDLGAVAHCTDSSAGHPENVVTVALAGASAQGLDEALASRRQVVTTSACGICGRRSIESLASNYPPVDPIAELPTDVIAEWPATLGRRQAAFAQTGGLHAAGLFSMAGELLDLAEDVGRHNAVDKVIGRLILAEALPIRHHVLFVSGRTSFEIVQKAWLAGIPCVASVSAPSSLAIELAQAAGIMLIGFVRDRGYNVYTGR